MVPQVFAHAWQVMDNFDSVPAQNLAVADTRELQQLGRRQRPGRQDDFTSNMDLAGGVGNAKFHTGCVLTIQENSRNGRIRKYRQIGPSLRRPQIPYRSTVA